MQGECSHEEYYSQFTTPTMRQGIIKHFGADRIKNAGEHLNGIPLPEWDRLGTRYEPFIRAKLKEAGDIFSPAGVVCVLKRAAREALA